MKKKKALDHPPKKEKQTQSRWLFDYHVFFGPLGLAVSPWVSVLGMFLIGMTCTFLNFFNACPNFQSF